MKSRLPEVLKQHLQDYEKDKENSVMSYQTILEQQILSIDREMLEKLTVSYDEAGISLLLSKSRYWKQVAHFQSLKGSWSLLKCFCQVDVLHIAGFFFTTNLFLSSLSMDWVVTESDF